eukprot:UN17231
MMLRQQTKGGTVSFDDIILQECIGEGTSGKVFKGIWNGSEVAVKTLKHVTKSDVGDLKSEVAFLEQNRHPNILCVYGYCTQNDHECMVTEYYPLGSLQDLQEKIKNKAADSFNFKTKLHILTQIAGGP